MGSCLQCGRVSTEGISEFCSEKCQALHRTRILGRLEELSHESAIEDAAAVQGLMSLGRATSRLQYSSAELPPERPKPQDSQPRGRLVAFLPAQGGSGASTVALHVAEAIARDANERVLLVDYDFHSSATAFRLGLEVKGVLDDLLRGPRVDEARLKATVSNCGAMDVLVPAAERGGGPVDVARLEDVIDAALRVYTTVVVDHPDAIYTTSHAVVEKASFVGIVCIPDIAALYLLRRKRSAVEKLLGAQSGRLGLIVNRSTSWGSLSPADVERVAEAPIVASLPNDYAAVREASWRGGFVRDESELARGFRSLAERIQVETRGASLVQEKVCNA